LPAETPGQSESLGRRFESYRAQTRWRVRSDHIGGIDFRRTRSSMGIVAVRGVRVGAEDKNQLVARLAAHQGGRLRQFLRRRVRNAADIPDLMQEVFLRLLRVPHHESIRTPEAYLLTIARHVAQQHRLAAAVENPVNLEDVLADLRSSSVSDPVLELTAEQCREELEEALRQMAPK